MKLFKQLAAVTSFAACVGIVAPSISHAAEPNHTLYPGTNNKNVAELQHTLKDNGYFKNSDVTGYYGTITENAVKAFQKDHHISVDGIAGPNTYKALDSNNESNNLGKDLLVNGSRGQHVSLLQDKLQRLGYYKGNVDGIFGTLTETAVKAFQSANGLSVDGMVGPNTRAALLNGHAAAPQPKASTPAPKTVSSNTNTEAAEAAENTKKAVDNTKAEAEKPAQPVKPAEPAKPAQSAAPAKQQNENQNKAVEQNNNQAASVNTDNNQSETAKADSDSNKTQVNNNDNAQTENVKAEANQDSNASADNNNAGSDSSNASSGTTVNVEATAYSLSGTTANGTQLNSGSKVIAVDPSVIPLGSKVYVPGYGTAIAADTGGAIKGNRIDVYIPNDSQAKNFGRKNIQVKVIK
ncbi:peptidoglycan-binding protein [Scopulibacillus cellulosilyticus]|uniref:Peptidoglycan-binding protein n=1 Tax=Scopulibacillus cellulosilyticus TaxID=2665665 RepID=A0ABW2PRM8_9BACL